RPEPLSANLIVGDRSGGAVELVAHRGAAAADESAAASVAASEVDLTLGLLRTIDSDPAANLLVSPSSLAVALAMLNYGARGKTQEQISKLLGPSGASADDIARGWSTLVADWVSAAAQNAITLS